MHGPCIAASGRSVYSELEHRLMTKLIESIFGENLPGLTRCLILPGAETRRFQATLLTRKLLHIEQLMLTSLENWPALLAQESGAMLKTNGKHMDLESSGQSRLVADLSGATKPDGNNVDIDLQMGRLAYNSGKFSIASNLMRRQLQMLKRAITEGGR